MKEEKVVERKSLLRFVWPEKRIRIFASFPEARKGMGNDDLKATVALMFTLCVIMLIGIIACAIVLVVG